MNLFFSELLLIIPELIIILAAILLLMIGSFSTKNSAKVVVYFSALTLFFVSFLEIIMPWDTGLLFTESLVEN